MKITFIEAYLDGGTQKIVTEDEKEYYIDGRIYSTTKGKIYSLYPGKSDSKMLDDVELYEEIIEAVKSCDEDVINLLFLKTLLNL
jgi:hypothetical protein